MAKQQKINAFTPKAKKKGRSNKKASKLKNSKNYTKKYKGQGT